MICYDCVPKLQINLQEVMNNAELYLDNAAH